MRNTKGITLIALIITIIVLLILAGVTLSTLNGTDNILFKANNVVELYESSVNDEQNKINKMANVIDDALSF